LPSQTASSLLQYSCTCNNSMRADSCERYVTVLWLITVKKLKAKYFCTPLSRKGCGHY
jgi:hypothetical protein